MKVNPSTMAAVIVMTGVFVATSTLARELSFDERVKAQAAIERVYYSHQIGATMAFEEAVPRAVLEKKVTTYLKQSVALDAIWHTPVTAEMLRREIERIAHDTRFPDRLLEIYAVLGNDAFLVEECFARPAVVDRLARSFQGGGEPEASWNAWWEVTEQQLDPQDAHVVSVPGRLPAVDAASASCPQPDAWANGVLGKVPHAGNRARGVWTGSSFVVWGGFGLGGIDPGFRYDPVIDDWTPMTTAGAPDWRYEPTLVWTGRVVIAWGGLHEATGVRDTGGRYDPVADQWQPTSTVGAPSRRTEHTAVWTGSRMIVWGGSDFHTGNLGLGTGGVYDPVTDTWTPTSNLNAPPARRRHVAVWTGSRMIVMAGKGKGPTSPFPDSFLSSGGVYDPASDTWQSTSGNYQGQYATAVWTGTEMFFWGGENSNGAFTNVGGRYQPPNFWTPISIGGAPSPRKQHNAVWTGSRMIVWGGTTASGTTNTGGIYDPAFNSWSPIATTGAPAARAQAVAVWTGSRMIVWGGGLNTGGRYDPASDSWTPTTTYGTPTPRESVAAAWTGTVAASWGGTSPGGRYDPLLDAWSPMAAVPGAQSDTAAPGVWTGNWMIAWGVGTGVGTPGRAWRYSPSTDSWVAASTAGAPVDRSRPSVVSTGHDVIVWGGIDPAQTYLGDGGRYDPNADAWTPLALTGAPAPRYNHSAVWDGSRMIVWGGYGAAGLSNTGGRYDPVGDLWEPMSAINAPTVRYRPTAVWTGTRMVVWGGSALPDVLNTGGRYDPISDSWEPTSLAGAPAPRRAHSAVWAGNRMLVFGGVAGFNPTAFGDLVVYEPVADLWSPGGSAGIPRARAEHAAVWDGSGMIVWGGSAYLDVPLRLENGGRYLPDSDADGLVGSCDNCPVANNPDQSNSDEDALGDACDNCPAIANLDQVDADGDGAGNACDACPLDPADDQDHDGRCASVDNCAGVFNHAQLDSDGDGVGDLCDICASIANASQVDTDGDGEGDACDCQPSDSNNRRPADANPLALTASGVSAVLSWPAVSGADTYAVTRGDLAAKASNQYGSCLAFGLVSPSYVDSALPEPGEGYFYLVQGVSATCGVGSLGTTSAEEPRVNANPGACP